MEKILKIADENNEFEKEDIESRLRKNEILKKILEIKKVSQAKTSLQTIQTKYSSRLGPNDFFSIKRSEYPMNNPNIFELYEHQHDLKQKHICDCDKCNDHYDFVICKKRIPAKPSKDEKIYFAINKKKK